jgi:hypothetical protein
MCRLVFHDMRDVDGIKPGGFLTGNIWRRPIQYRLGGVEVLYTSLVLLAPINSFSGLHRALLREMGKI